MKFKKITAIAGSLLMTGLTAAIASAAAFPMPFVDDGKADVAIVYGATADMVASNNVHTALGKFVTTSGAVSVVGGDSYKLEKASENFNFGDTVADVLGASSTIDDDDMPLLLVEDEYTDETNDDFDYNQKIVLNDSLKLGLFENSDYIRDQPTIGIEILDGQHILDYTLEFDDQPLITNIPESDLPIMGKEYYVLDATFEKFTLLDSAVETILSEEETETIAGKTVTIEFIGDNQVKLNVDGEITNSLAAGETYKLNDESYVGIREVLFSSKEGTVSKVEFSIGSGKLVLENDKTVELNDEDIDGLTSTIVNESLELTDIILTWTTEDDVFVTEDSEIVMPGFEVIKLSYVGIDFPMEESFIIEHDGSDSMVLSNVMLKNTEENINVGYWNGTQYMENGKSLDQLISLDGTFDRDTDDWALLTWNKTDEAESYLVRASGFDEDNGENTTDLEYRKDGAWTNLKDEIEEGDDFSIGELNVIVGAINVDDETIVFTGQDSNDTLYTEEGLQIILEVAEPVNGTTTLTVNISEEDDDDNLGLGESLYVVLGANADLDVEVDSVTGSTTLQEEEIEDTDKFLSYLESSLATKVLEDTSGDEKTLDITYHGEEVIGHVYLSSSETEVSSAAASEFLPVKASEIDDVKGKNLIIVGGSCVNSAAATLLGGALCGEAFTSATGVGSGQFVIEEFMDKFTTGKTALLVAGYEQADTMNAVTYLTKMDDVDTSTRMVMGLESVQELV